jgi:proline iminopeptidase
VTATDQTIPTSGHFARYVDEVDQVRKAIGGTKENFCLLGHSWGGILAMEYALAHQDQMKCLVISNMNGVDPGLQRLRHEGPRAADEPGGAKADPGH